MKTMKLVVGMFKKNNDQNMTLGLFPLIKKIHN